MRPFLVIFLAASALCAFESCDHRAAPKFRVGDKVRVKLTREEGTVSLWTRFFRDDRYLVRLPGSENVRTPVRDPDPEFDAAWAAWAATQYGPAVFTQAPKISSHDEGPFYDTELERMR
jgi:hypothetical protein